MQLDTQHLELTNGRGRVEVHSDIFREARQGCAQVGGCEERQRRVHAPVDHLLQVAALGGRLPGSLKSVVLRQRRPSALMRLASSAHG